jgi:hypothetical protein
LELDVLKFGFEDTEFFESDEGFLGGLVAHFALSFVVCGIRLLIGTTLVSQKLFCCNLVMAYILVAWREMS